MNEVSTNTILDTMKEWVEQKKMIGPELWLDAAAKLNVLISDEHDRLFRLQQGVARMKVEHIKDGDSVAAAKSKVEATDLYMEMKIQEARIAQIEEFIRISKLQARMKDNEYRLQ